MTSAVPLVIRLLKAAAPVGALVGDRIEPERAPDGGSLPLIVVRSSSSRQVYGLARSAPLREGRLNVLCAASTYSAAEKLAEAVIAALKDVRAAKVAGKSITVMQDGEDAGTWDESGRTFNRIVGFRVSISG